MREYCIGDFVAFRDPEYPELKGAAEIIEIIGEEKKAVKVQYSDGSRFDVATRLLREANEKEKEEYRREMEDAQIERMKNT